MCTFEDIQRAGGEFPVAHAKLQSSAASFIQSLNHRCRIEIILKLSNLRAAWRCEFGQSTGPTCFLIITQWLLAVLIRQPRISGKGVSGIAPLRTPVYILFYPQGVLTPVMW